MGTSSLVATGIDAVSVEVAILDPEGMIEVVNEDWRRFADQNGGEHPNYWVGENYLEVCRRAASDPYAADAIEGLDAILAGERTHFRLEYPCHSADEQRWFMLDAAGFLYDGDQHVFLLHLDITDRKIAERQAEARTAQLETLLKVLSHDLRNPLNVIDGYTELLAEELGQRDEIETIQQAITRITEITNATFSFTQSDALSEIEPLSIAELARTAWVSVPTADATLTIQDSQTVYGDQHLLLHLFEALIQNAIEHAGTQCTVTVGTLPDGFYVEDDGPGIPESLRKTALNPDFSTAAQGGLGLAIVQTVAHAHGGQVTITEVESGGARFEITGLDIAP